MDRRQRLAVHLPRKQDFVDLHLASRNRHSVVVNLALFEVRVCAEELEMSTVVLETAAVLDDFLEGDTGPARGSNSALAPWSVDELVAVAGVLVYLLDTACSRALKADDCGLAGEDGLILELGKGNLFWVLD